MTGIETIAFGVLWLVLAALTVLVLILYRQVEKTLVKGLQSPGLPVGSIAPPVDVLGAGKTRTIQVPPEGDQLLIFASTTCDSCEKLIAEITRPGYEPPAPALVLVVGEGFDRFAAEPESDVQLEWLANPADMTHSYRVNVVPTAYLIRDGRIAAMTTDPTAAGLRTLNAVPELQELTVVNVAGTSI